MCQLVTGDMEVLKIQTAYKVVQTAYYSQAISISGPYYMTRFLSSNGWAENRPPKSIISCFSGKRITHKGYHVFKTRLGAVDYYIDFGVYNVKLKVIEVQIRGSAIPFIYSGYEGYAVETWKPIKPKLGV